MESILIAAAPFLVMLLVWVIRTLFGHSHRIKMNESDIAELKKIDIKTKLTNHESRIVSNEADIEFLKKMHQSFIIKFDSLISSSARIEGALMSKKDKE